MSIAASIRSQLVPIHRKAIPSSRSSRCVTLILFWLWEPFGWIGVMLTVWCALFFRDPCG